MKREKEISKFMADPKFLIARSYSNYKFDAVDHPLTEVLTSTFSKR